MDDERIVVRRAVGPPPFALRVAAVLVVPLLLYALVATGQKAIDKYRLNQEAERLRAEVVSLRAENVQLQQSLEDARTDVAIETIAREQLGLIKPGDHPIVMIGQPAVQPAAAPNPAESPESAQGTGSADSTRGAAQSPRAAASPSGDPGSAPSPGSSAGSPGGAPRPAWRQWWDYFFGQLGRPHAQG